MNIDTPNHPALVLRLLALLAVAIAATVVTAGSADAAVFCVHKNPCPVGGTAAPTITAALDVADSNNTTDTVLIGANGGQPYAENLFYSDSETVHLIGDGAGQTVIAPPGPGLAGVTVTSPSSTIEDLTIHARDADSVTGLSYDGTASRIEVVHSGTPLLNLTGIRAEAGAVLEDSTVRTDGFTAINVPAGGSLIARGSTVSSRGVGVSAAATDSDLTLRGSSVTAGRAAIQTAGPLSSATLENSVLRATTGFNAGDGAISALSGSSIVARHLTVVGPGTGAGIVLSADSTSTSVIVRDTVIENFGWALRCYGDNGFVATLGVSYSNWTDPNDLEPSGQCSSTLGAGNTTHDPRFVGGLLGNLRLRSDSELIDAGDPASPSTVDRDGESRPVDGDGAAGARADIGAYEYQRRPPTATALVPATSAAGESVAFSASGSSDPDDGDDLTETWDFGDGTAATGFAPTHAFATAGTYSVTLTVTDSTGLTDVATAQIAVTGPPAPPAVVPETRMSKAPSRGQLRRRRAEFRFSSPDPAATFECSLDGDAFTACSSPKFYKGLARGRHTFAARAVGPGGPDASPAAVRFKIKKRRS